MRHDTPAAHMFNTSTLRLKGSSSLKMQWLECIFLFLISDRKPQKHVIYSIWYVGFKAENSLVLFCLKSTVHLMRQIKSYLSDQVSCKDYDYLCDSNNL